MCKISPCSIKLCLAIIFSCFSANIWADNTENFSTLTKPSHQNQSMPDPAKDLWWQGFHDSLLDSLISIASTNNYDLKIALRRMEISRLQMKQAESAWWPTVSASAGWNKTRTSGCMGSVAGKATANDYFSLGAQANWEIDIFGKVKANVKAKKEAQKVSSAEYAAAIVSLCSELAYDYLSLRAAQAQLNVSQELLKAQGEVLHIAEVRHEVSLASGLDVSQAKTVYLSTKASIPALKTTIAHTINAITILLGEEGNAWKEKLTTPEPIPFYAASLHTDITGEMLRRRPDVMEAEALVAEYAAMAGVAEKDFLPTLTLTASAGVDSHSLRNLLKKDAFSFSVTPTLTWAVFTGFNRKYALLEAREQMKSGVDNYNFVVLNACSEVDDALETYRNSIERTALLGEVLNEARKSLNYSVDLYKQGLSPFMNVMDSQIDVLNYNNQLIAEQATAQQAIVALYKALGGGWENKNSKI